MDKKLQPRVTTAPEMGKLVEKASKVKATEKIKMEKEKTKEELQEIRSGKRIIIAGNNNEERLRSCKWR